MFHLPQVPVDPAGDTFNFPASFGPNPPPVDNLEEITIQFTPTENSYEVCNLLIRGCHVPEISSKYGMEEEVFTSVFTAPMVSV